MKRFRFVGVGVVVFVALAVGAAPAMAWEETECKEFLKGLYSDNLCKNEVTLGTGKFELLLFLLAEWLEGGNPVTETMLVETEGEVTLANLNAPIVKTEVSILCSGFFDGWVGPDGLDEITEILDLEKIATGEPLVGHSITCTTVKLCEGGAKLVWPVNLPWLTELELFERDVNIIGFDNLILPHPGGGNPGWYVECTVLGVKSTEECTGPEGVTEEKNVAEGVEGIFAEEFRESLGVKLALCTGNNEETGAVITETGTGGDLPGITRNSLTPTLSVSSVG